MPQRDRLIFLSLWLMLHISFVIVYPIIFLSSFFATILAIKEVAINIWVENFGKYWVAKLRTIYAPPENFWFTVLGIAISWILTRIFELFQSFAISCNSIVIHLFQVFHWLLSLTSSIMLLRRCIITSVHVLKRTLCTKLSSLTC